MLRKLIATGIVLLIGYTLGTIFGYRAAVVDYVENDAEQIESIASEMYPSPSEGARTIPDEVGAVMEEVEREDDDSAQADGGSRGFQ